VSDTAWNIDGTSIVLVNKSSKHCDQMLHTLDILIEWRKRGTAPTQIDYVVTTLRIHRAHTLIEHSSRMLLEGKESEQLEAATTIRRLLDGTKKDPSVDILIRRKGTVERLIQLLRTSVNARIQFECAWILINIANGTTEQVGIIVDAGAISVLAKNIQSIDADVKETCVWALGNIAGDSTPHCDRVLDSNVMSPVLQLLCSQDASVILLRCCTMLLSNVCKFQTSSLHRAPTIIADALPVLSRLLRDEQDAEILINVCWALLYIAHNKYTQAIIDSGAVPRLVQLMTHPSNAAIHAQQSVLHVSVVNAAHTQALIDAGVLPSLRMLITEPTQSIRICACQIISNITAENETQTDAVIHADVVPALITILTNDAFDVKKKAAWAIVNITCHQSIRQIRYLVEQQQVLPRLCSMLTCSESDVILRVMRGIDNILCVSDADANLRDSYAALVEQHGGAQLRAMHTQLTLVQSIRDFACYILTTYLTRPYIAATTAAAAAAAAVAEDDDSEMK
jgi:importin subunit alpha-1